MLRYAHYMMCALLLLGAACSRRTANSASAPAVGVATLRDATGRTVGTASVSEVAGGGGVQLRIDVQGLTPGAHGVHIHAVGNCDATTATPFSSAGGHFNPTARQHGRLNPNGWHGGDLPNLIVNASGVGSPTVVAEGLTIDTGPSALFDADGSAVIVHANQDDERTDNGPAGPGGSGARVACGVIARR